MRLVTRSDFDGLVTAVLLKKLGMIDEMKFVHPKDMQDGLIEISANDILTNVPYMAGKRGQASARGRLRIRRGSTYC
jgi:hypothetical protein